MKKRQIKIICMLIMLFIAGCGNEQQAVSDDKTAETGISERTENEDIAELYYDIYQEVMEESVLDRKYASENMAGNDIADNNAVAHGTMDSLEITRSIVEKIGERGYVVVDSDNQINMEGAEQVINFCTQIENGETAQLAIIVAAYGNGFLRYDCRTEEGNIDVVREYYQYADKKFQCTDKSCYRADVWQLTKEGYLLFSGSAFSEESYVLTLSDVVEHAAWRILPLDEKYRELNRRYILPVGYRQNNLFLFDWDGRDYGALDFNDLFTVLYEKVYGRPMPYQMDENPGIGAVYQIPKEEFESVIFSYFEIDSENLQAMMEFSESSQCYFYRPRGFYELEYSEMPYPEVVDARENKDGTLTLVVNVVYPNENLSKVYAHEVVVRPLSEESFVYVSNRIIPSKDNYEATWHTERLTKEEREEYYGYHIPLDDEERQEAENDCMDKIGLVQGIYETLSIEERGQDILPKEIIRDAAEKIAQNGDCVITSETYVSLLHYEAFEQFLEKAKKGQAGEKIIYTEYQYRLGETDASDIF